jgi:hypothetical protein
MKYKIQVRLAVILTLLLLVTALPAPTRAASALNFTITIGGAYLRAEPSLAATTTQPVFAGEVYPVVGRSADDLWVLLNAPKAGTGAWILASLGSVGGDLSAAPVVAITPKVARATVGTVTRGVPVITARQKLLYQQAVRQGKDANFFTVVGDCNSESTAYLGRLAAGTFQLPKGQEYLQSTIVRFASSFTRSSMATHGSFGAQAMFDTDWVDPSQCAAGEGPLACELRVSDASVVFIALGTGDQYEWQDFEANYRQVVSYTLQSGALPVLVTKADDLETHSGATSGYINGVIRRLAREYGVPVMDFWQATRSLPGYGLRNEGNDNFHMTPAGSDLRVLMTLQTLEAITRK